MKSAKRIIALLMAVVLCLCAFSGCSYQELKATAATLSVGITAFNGCFSPFYAELPGNCDIMEMTQLKLLSTDREGRVVLNGIYGETAIYNGTEYAYTGPADVMIITNENGTVDYQFTLREDLCFSDGTPLTADDVIFTMYVLCDPMYDGPSDFASLPIKGLVEYRTGMTPKWRLILQDTPKNAASGSEQAYYTSEEALSFWSTFNRVGELFAQEIVEQGIADGLGMDVCTVAEAIGYGGLPESAVAIDLFNAIVDRCGYDTEAIDREKATHSFENLLLQYLNYGLLVGVATGESAPTIEGIRKTGEYSFCVTLTEADETALSYFCIDIAPLHYYGNVQLYNDKNATFGLNKGDLTSVRKRNSKPLGAGSYRFVNYENGTVTFKANTLYYRGTPKIENVVVIRTAEYGKIDRLNSGVIDLTVAELGVSTVSALEKTNGGVLNGDILKVQTTGDIGYGYVGINADAVKVGDDPSSEQSKNLRRALATVMAYYRQMSVAEYYGDRGEVAEFPFAQKTAYAYDVHGREIDLNTAETEEERLAAVMQASVEYLEAAGFTLADGKAIAAPTGAKLSYDVWFPGQEIGNHPAYRMLADASEALETVGIELVLHDVSYGNVYNEVRWQSADIWCADRDVVTDTALYTAYFSGDTEHPAGGSWYMTDINDSKLDQLILQMKNEQNAEAKQLLWTDCFAIVEDWAVEVPVCQEKRALIFRAAEVDGSTVAQDVTGYYSWVREIQNLMMNG